MIYRVWRLFALSIAFIDFSLGDNDLTKLSIANNDLGLKLYRILAKDAPGNMFFSPFSLSNALGMVFDGSRGKTAKQLRSVLGYEAAHLPRGKVPSAFNDYLNKILPKDKPEKPDYVLNLANELLVSSKCDVISSYKKDIHDLFHANIQEVDFEENSDEIVNEVNSWVKEQTHGKITKLLESVDPSTVLLILNAIYFKGNWKIEFNKRQTRKQKFYNDGSDSKAKEVPLMHVTDEFPYAYVDDVKALELPYKGDNISMIILLPKEKDGLKSLEDSITLEKFQSIQKRLYTTKVVVTFPKFKVDYHRNMVGDFEALGATDVFNPNQANLTGIIKYSPNYQVFVDEIVHKAAIEVNEEGSEAAAATGVGMIFIAPAPPPPPPKEFKADHPFMYAIIDKRNDMMLFLGSVTEL